MELLRLFTSNLLPVFLAAGTGYVLVARTRVPVRPLAQVAFYVFAPCLVFRIIVEGSLPGDVLLRMGVFSFLSLATTAAVAALLGRALRWPRTVIAAAVLVALTPNAGNFGLSANLFAFGDEGLAYAGVFFVTSSILSYTVGVFVASLGRSGVGRALAGLPKVPVVWAVVAAGAVEAFHLRLPFPLERALHLLADGCIPVFLVVLGMQLHVAGWKGRGWPLIVATSLRMLGGIAVGVLYASLLGLEGTARQAGIFQSAMPAAVINIILAAEYDVEPDLVTSIVLVSTLLCPLTLTPLLAWLGA